MHISQQVISMPDRQISMKWTIFSFVVFSQFLTFIECVTQYHYGTPPESILRADGGTRISGIQDYEDKDIILGGLLRVHTGDGSGKCGEIFLDKTLEHLEAVFFGIDLVNNDPHVLPNITLGYDIRDTCISENIALDESVDLVLSSGRLELESCEEPQSNNVTTEPPVVAVIGAVYSSVSIPVASFFRLFKVPQVSFASTSPLLNNRDLYTYFHRTVPPDSEQAQAMIDLILYFGWDHVSTIYSKNLYGQPGINEFHDLADANGVCIDFNKGIDDSTNYVLMAKNLMNSSANVVVFFGSPDHVDKLLTEVQTLYRSGRSKRRFLWIASDSWSQTFAAKFQDITIGKWGTAPFSETMPSFDTYYSQLTPATNARNPWFSEFYERYHDCIISVNCSNISFVNDSSYNYQQDSFDVHAVDAVYSVAHAINNFLNDNCNQPLVWYRENQTCLGQKENLNGLNLLEYIKNVNFTSPTGNKVSFDKHGNVKAKYNIFNYQVISSCQSCNKSFDIVNVGYWDGNAPQNRLKFKPDITKQFGLDESGNILYQLNSQCQSCNPGYIKRKVVSSCCGTCDPCLGQNYTNTTSSTECQTCPQYMWGNDPLTGSNGCVDIEESYLKPSDGWSIVLILLAIIGLLAVVFVSGVFIYFWNTPIVKSSGREQMVLLLTGITLCFLITVVFIPKPSVAVCTLQRIGAWFCFSLIISALFIKLVRITRIFLNKNISTRPKYISPMYQILFTILLVGVQMVFVLISLNVVHPDMTKSQVNDTQDTNNFPVLSIQCTTPHAVLLAIQMLYLSALLIVSNGLAILTIRFPQNFNESRYVAFSTFALGLTWIAFILTYVATEAKYQSAVISVAIQLSALAVLVCLFGPRVFIMIVWPSQNVSATTTNPSTSKRQRVTSVSIVELPPSSNEQNMSIVSTDIDENKS